MSTAILPFAAADSVKTRGLSLPAVVGFFFAARGCVTYLFFTADPQQGSIAAFALSMLLLLVVGFYAFGPAAKSTSQTPTVRWVFAFLAVSLCSLAWGETVSLPIAFAYWLGMASDVFLVLLLLRSGPAEDVSQRILRGYVIGACLVAAVMWLAPTMQDLRPGDDELFSPNAIGFLCGFGAFLAQFLTRSDKAWKWPAIFLSISMLRSLSKTTLIAFAAGQFILLARDKTLSRSLKLQLLLAATSVLAIFSGLIAAYIDVYANSGRGAVTLTGRIGIWLYVLDRSYERPWFGHGFHSVRHVIPMFGGFETWHAHNELIQQFYAYGVLGILLLLGVYGSFYLQSRRLKKPTYRALALGLITFIVVRGLADTERFDLSFPLWSLTLFSLMFVSHESVAEVSA